MHVGATIHAYYRQKNLLFNLFERLKKLFEKEEKNPQHSDGKIHTNTQNLKTWQFWKTNIDFHKHPKCYPIKKSYKSLEIDDCEIIGCLLALTILEDNDMN
jgi:hypothetical protein